MLQSNRPACSDNGTGRGHARVSTNRHSMLPGLTSRGAVAQDGKWEVRHILQVGIYNLHIITKILDIKYCILYLYCILHFIYYILHYYIVHIIYYILYNYILYIKLLHIAYYILHDITYYILAWRPFADETVELWDGLHEIYQLQFFA